MNLISPVTKTSQMSETKSKPKRSEHPSRAGRSARENEIDTYVIIPPDGGWGWLVVIGAFFSYFITDGLLYSFGTFLKDIAQSLECTKSKVSLAGAVNSCLFCISGPFSAAMVNKFGYRVVTYTGSALACISCILTSFSTNIYMLICFYGVIGGIGFGMIYITAVIVVGYYFERWRALATGLAVCGAGIGAISLPPIISILLKHYGWRNTFRALACTCICLCTFGSLFRKIKPIRIIITTEGKRVVASTVSKKSSYFAKYNNTTFSKVLEKMSNSTLMEVYTQKLASTNSSEIITTTYPIGSTNTSYKSIKTTKCSTIFEEHIGKWICCTPCCATCRKNKENVLISRPLYRDDIFFSGSVIDLPEYKKSVAGAKLNESNTKSNFEYHLSVTRVSLPEDTQSKCCTCSMAVKRTLGTMLDFRLLKTPKFALMVLNATFISLGFYTPYIFIKDSSVQQGIPEKTAFWLISTIGLSNTFGRIFCGVLSTLPKVRAIAVSYSFLLVGGTATIFSTFCYELWAQFLYCSVYGLAMSSMSALRTVLIVEMLGLEKLTNAIGMILMFQGLATLTGISVSGFLKDLTGNYKCSFYFAGACITISSLFLFIIHVHYTSRK